MPSLLTSAGPMLFQQINPFFTILYDIMHSIWSSLVFWLIWNIQIVPLRQLRGAETCTRFWFFASVWDQVLSLFASIMLNFKQVHVYPSPMSISNKCHVSHGQINTKSLITTSYSSNKRLWLCWSACSRILSSTEKKMLLSGGAPTALVSLIGPSQYRRSARDIYYFLQVSSSNLWHLI